METGLSLRRIGRRTILDENGDIPVAYGERDFHHKGSFWKMVRVVNKGMNEEVK